MAVIVFTLMVTVARALRFPNEFAMTHWLFDYRFGFMKRGLVGSLCSLVANLGGVSMSRAAILVLSSTALMGFFALLLVMIFQAMGRFTDQPQHSFVALAVVSSPFVVLSGDLIGYFDNLIYLLTALAIALVLADRPGSAGFVSVVGVLTHENYLVVGLPLVAFASYVRSHQSTVVGALRRHTLGLLPALLAFCAILGAAEWGNAQELRRLWVERLEGFDFVSHRSGRTTELVTTAFSQFWDLRFFGTRLVNDAILGPSAPTLATLLVFAHMAYRVTPLSRLSSLLLLSVLSPWLLHALAWDSIRISAYPVCGALFAIWILAKRQPPQPVSSAVTFLALGALYFNVFGRTPLVDGTPERFSNSMRLALYAPAALLAISTLVESRRSLPRRSEGAPLLEE